MKCQVDHASLRALSYSLRWAEFWKILNSYDTQETLMVTLALVQIEKILVAVIPLHHPCYDSLPSDGQHEQIWCYYQLDV